MSEHREVPTDFVKLNGNWLRFDWNSGERLSYVLRERLDTRDVKVGCDAGDCGACTVLLDGVPVCACLTPAAQVAGRKVETLAGIAAETEPGKSLVEVFQDHGAAQCGICTPGMMVSAVALLRHEPNPTESQVQDALAGVLCRCTGYRKIVDAVLAAGGNGTARSPLNSGAVGSPVRRLDGYRKVVGTELFGDDVGTEGALSLRIIRSPHSRARFKLGDLDSFVSEREGIALVLTSKDIPGKNRFGVFPGFHDQPVFAEAETRFRGEAVAAVVGDQLALRDIDMDDFPIFWEELPYVETMLDAMDPAAPAIHEDRDRNVMCGGIVRTGNADAALTEADFVAEGSFTTSFVEHAYIEPEAGMADLSDGRLQVRAGTQAPEMDRKSLASILAMDASEIRIIPTAVGGGFGSKLDLSVQPYLALAALKTGREVRLAYTRTESMQSTTKRHPAEISMKIGVARDGHLKGLKFRGKFNTGAYASWGPTVVNRVPVHASGPYRVRHYFAESQAIHTNCPPSGAFRGFGVPQTAIAQESLFDELATILKMDALEFRILNALDNGVPTVCGQVFESGVGIKACLTALRGPWKRATKIAERFNRMAKQTSSPLRQGAGVAAGWYGCGNTSLPNPSTIKAGVRSDGTIVLHQGAVDIGQGSITVVSQIFAESLGVPVNLLALIGGDTDVTPDAGKTSASRQTFVSGNAARQAGAALRRDILKLCNASQNAKLEIADGAIRISDGSSDHVVYPSRLVADDEGYVLRSEETYDPPTKPLNANGQGSPYAQFGYAAQMAMVEVDVKLGTVRAVKFAAAHDVGKAINPMLVEGQIQGGIAQGLGMALMEEFMPGRTENLHDYLIPTIGDMPPVEPIIIEVPDAHGPYGAKGLGEHVLIPTAPAILNAIFSACGARIRHVPATPERVCAALRDSCNE